MLHFERQLTIDFDEEKKYGFELRNNLTTRVYSREFSEAYSKKLNGQVERLMRLAIQAVASYWYTAWVDAGQPDLSTFPDALTAEEQQRLEMEKKEYEAGQHTPREEGNH